MVVTDVTVVADVGFIIGLRIVAALSRIPALTLSFKREKYHAAARNGAALEALLRVFTGRQAGVTALNESSFAFEQSETARIYPNVVFRGAADISDFVLVGVPPRGVKPGERPTVIGGPVTLRSHAVIYAGVTIGDYFQCGHGCLIREQTRIGHRVSIGSHTVIEFSVSIADAVRIHSQAFIPEYSVLEEGCWIGPNVVLTNAKYPAARDTKDRLAGVHVGALAKIGANSTILPGVRLGERCLIGAGTVVTRDVPPGAVVVGNPGRIIKMIDDLPCDGYVDIPADAVRHSEGAIRRAG